MDVHRKDVRLPVQLQRAMAAEAEATREARAKVIAAEGEQRASRALKEAAEVIACSPAALQLRYLQTLNSIASERNSTIVFPVPMELFRGYTSDGGYNSQAAGAKDGYNSSCGHYNNQSPGKLLIPEKAPLNTIHRSSCGKRGSLPLPPSNIPGTPSAPSSPDLPMTVDA